MLLSWEQEPVFQVWYPTTMDILAVLFEFELDTYYDCLIITNYYLFIIISFLFAFLGIVAACIGAQVTFSDRRDSPVVLQNIQTVININRHLFPHSNNNNNTNTNSTRNNSNNNTNQLEKGNSNNNNERDDNTRVIGFTWGQFNHEILQLEQNIDVLIGADILYDEKGILLFYPIYTLLFTLCSIQYYTILFAFYLL